MTTTPRPAAEAPRAAQPAAGPAGAVSVLAAVSLGWLGVGYALSSLGPCLILLARDLSTAREKLSWVSSGYGIGLLVLGVAGGILLRGGGRPFLRLSAACLAAGAALLGAAPSLHPAQAGALLLGLGAAGIVLVTPVLLAGAGAGPMARAVGFASVSGILAPLLISAVDGGAGTGGSRSSLSSRRSCGRRCAQSRRGTRRPRRRRGPPRPHASGSPHGGRRGGGWLSSAPSPPSSR
jgi:hypothetical protein